MVKSVRIRNGVVVPSKAWVDWLDDVLGSEDTGTVLFIPDGEKLEGAVEEALQYLSDLAGLADDTQASAGIKMIVNGARERIAAARAELAMQQPARQVEGDPRVEAAEHLRTVSRSGRCSRCLSLADALEAQMAQERVVEVELPHRGGIVDHQRIIAGDNVVRFLADDLQAIGLRHAGRVAFRYLPDPPKPKVRPYACRPGWVICPGPCFELQPWTLARVCQKCGAHFGEPRDLPG